MGTPKAKEYLRIIARQHLEKMKCFVEEKFESENKGSGDEPTVSDEVDVGENTST